MARRYNKAGKYGKDEAAKRFNWWLTGGFFTALALGFGGGLFFGHEKTYTTFALFLGFAAILWTVLNKLDAISDRWMRERIRFARGAQAEALVAWILQALEDDWYLFNNVQLERDCDLDHVLIGPGGVWCISTKSHRGLLAAGTDGRLLYNNEPSGFADEAFGLAMELRKRLAALLGADAPYVNAVLAAPFAFTQVKNPTRHVWVVHQENLREVIEKSSKRLSGEQVRRVVGVMEMIAKSAKEHYRRAEAPARATAVEGAGRAAPITPAERGRGGGEIDRP